ncbi:hypothetical protein AXY20_RS02205 [Acinetobacter baumannii]|nr:hypothetical protein [Acinetobacter baumannii]
MNKTVVIFSVCVAAIIFSFLLFSILAILFFYWGDTSSVKDALSTVSGIFGGITTIGAAIIAAYFFNDWKEQQRYQNSIEFGKMALDSFKKYDNSFDNFVDELIMECSSLENESSYFIDEEKLDYLIELSEETYNLFYSFHDDFIEHLYVRYPLDHNNKLIIDSTINKKIEKWEEDITYVHKKIIELNSEKHKNEFNLLILKELTESPWDDITGDIYPLIRDIILKPLKLEDS